MAEDVITNHHHSHHHHHHHHHRSSSSSDGLIGEFKRYIEAKKAERKYKDSTSIYRSRMRERRLRKKIMESLLLILTMFVTILVGLGVVYAYYIDT
jgi:hypothetical protein